MDYDDISTNSSDNYSYAQFCITQSGVTSLFGLVVYCGTTISIISAFENILIFCALINQRDKWNSYFHYLILLAFFECLLSICYIPLIVVDQLKDIWESLELTRFWWTYFTYLMTLCHICMGASCYLILAVTFERYLIASKSNLYKKIKKNRVWMSFFAISMAIITKGPIVFEMTLRSNGPNCTGRSEHFVDLTDIVSTFWYGTVYRFWIRNVLTVFVPFALLAYFNVCIVRILRVQARRAVLFRFADSDHKALVRSATRMLVIVVSTYLISNILNVIVTALEFVDSTILMEYQDIYFASTDIVSLLTILSCALRLPIYLLCNKALRIIILSSVKKMKKRPSLFGESMMRKFSTNYNPQRRKSGTDFDRFAIYLATYKPQRKLLSDITEFQYQI